MKKIISSLALVITGVMLIAAVYFYPQLPEQVASHWNVSGEADGYISKFWGVFLMPSIALGMLVLFWLILKIDPRRNNIQVFFVTLQLFIGVLFIFFAYVYALTLWWNLVGRFNFIVWLMPALAPLIYTLGELVAKAEANWFIGIRTPWTLDNDVVWKRTHALGGRLYKCCAFIPLLVLVAPQAAIWTLLVSIIGVSLFLFAYSYVEFLRQKKF